MKKYKLCFLIGITSLWSLNARKSATKKWDISNPEGTWNFKEHKVLLCPALVVF
tara:strand:+ start:75631 stop:75792 length:162 start_codon:yes stop_codon:yes gene_type:complete